MDLNKIKEIIDTNEFKEQCKNELKRAVNIAKKHVNDKTYRKKELAEYDIVVLIFNALMITIFMIWFIYFFFKTFQYRNCLLFGFYLLASIFIIFEIFVLCVGLNSDKKLEQKRIIKTFLFKKMLSLIGGFEYITYPPKRSKELAVSLMKSKIFYSMGIFGNVDDHFRGTYKNIKLRIYDIEVYSEKSHIIYVRMPCKKRFNGFTLISNSYNVPSFGERIKLEDIEFENKFSVVGSNQIDARYLITTGLMQRLLESNFYNFRILFEGSEIHFLFRSFINAFELDENELITNINDIKKPILKLINIFEIIDELKLNQNIGL